MSSPLRVAWNNRAAPEIQASGDNKNERKTLPKTTPRERLILFAIGNRTIYGLGIQKAIEECSNGTESIRIGSLYPALHTLEKKGLVVSESGETPPTERCGAKRKYYRLTDTGKEVIQDILDFQQRLLLWDPT